MDLADPRSDNTVGKAGEAISLLKELQVIYPTSQELKEASRAIHIFGCRMMWWSD